ncbi:chitin disaccharide deacetylase [Salisediminibacterium halotolerans]|uniref:Carbohydrate deacetylase n=1 Tax=Salisediminibacterium halotolerans TaxID=517425 RepID=A0A1H9RE75_9BACI|nr:chitin disaccharide deacetylase [Salisediminibacterium haloalkalitolerans]SER71026.1 PTS system, cellobiose-specific IIA component/hypothetical protein [Salisediminibacterium haloalkalitolerans]
MITFIVNADDFGYSRAVNYGILDAYLFGAVNSATVMMNMPGTDHAMKIAHDHPDLRVGVHFNLTCGPALIQEHKTIIDENGSFFKPSQLSAKKDIDLNEIEREWRAQLELFYAYGFKPSHIDSHHHVHTFPETKDTVMKLAREFNLKVRTFAGIDESLALSDSFTADFFGAGASFETLNAIAANAKDGETVEIMTHPAYLDTAIMNGSSYTEGRLQELDVLMNWPVPADVKL